MISSARLLSSRACSGLKPKSSKALAAPVIPPDVEGDDVAVCNVYLGESIPDPASLSGVVVTGSSALVTEREDWSERSAHWLTTAVESSSSAMTSRFPNTVTSSSATTPSLSVT